MKPRSSIMAKWQWNKVGPDDFSRPENTSRLGRATAGLFVATVVVGLVMLGMSIDLPNKEGIELRRVIERYETIDGNCHWNVTSVFQNHEATNLDVVRLEIPVQGTSSWIRPRGDGGSIPAGETVEFSVLHPLGDVCPESIRDIVHGDIVMVTLAPPNGEENIRSFRL